MERKRNNELPPQFARARRRKATTRTETESTSKLNSKKGPSLFQSFKAAFQFSAPKKVEKKISKSGKKKAVKTPVKKAKKSARKRGVIATMAAVETPSTTKKSAVKKAVATKRVSHPPAVKFMQTDIDLSEGFTPHMVQNAAPPTPQKTHSSVLGIFGSHKAKSKKTDIKVNLDFLSPVASTQAAEPAVQEKPTKEKKRSWFSFGKKETAEVVPETPVKRGAIATMAEDDQVDLKAMKQELKLLKKQRKVEAKQLRKRAEEIAAEMATETDPEAEAQAKKQQMLEVDQRIADKETQRKERERHQEELERRQAQANRDLDTLAMNLAKKKKKKGGGISGFLKSVNNLGMGKFRAQFIQNLAMMLNAGLPLIDSLNTLQMEIKSRAMRKVIGRIAELVDSGHPLWRAMEEQYLFSPYEVALIRVGEDAGNLARNAQYLAEQQEKDHALRQKVKMAMIYPTIVFVLMFIVVMGLGLFVLPNLVQVLYSLNADLPATTRAVIWVTEMFSTYGKQAVPAMLGGMLGLFLLAKYTAFRRVSQWFVFRIPGIGRLAREATIARFGVILGGLLEAGVPLVESIQSLEDVTHIVSYKRMYGKMAERVALGDSFAICFKDIRGSRKLIPASMQQLIITGERSGTLSDTFKKVASIYEKKAEETAEKLPTILEPMLLLIIGGLVGTIAFAIITPIYSVVGNVGR